MNLYPAVWAHAYNEQETARANIKIIFLIFNKL